MISGNILKETMFLPVHYMILGTGKRMKKREKKNILHIQEPVVSHVL
jgi:hypothetical protein